MCTIILALNVDAETPLMVAANRDELLDRISQPPGWHDHADGRFFGPKDLQRGGTWIGVNPHGVFVALTNRADVTSKRGRPSRGWLVRDALAEAVTAHEAASRTVTFALAEAYNGFNLVVADRRGAVLVRNDDQRVSGEALADGIHIITNLGVLKHDEDADAAPARIRAIREHLFGIDLRSCLRGALGVHGVGLNAVCVHQPERNYGTKSSTFIEADAGWTRFSYEHREGPACGGAFVREPDVPIGSE